MLKRLLLASAIAAVSNAAMAADVIYEEPAAPVVELAPAFSWTGFYVGGKLGYLFDNATEVSASNGAGGFSDRYLLNDDGIIGGAFAGYNFEYMGLVLGAEGDFEFTDSDDSRETFRGLAVTSANIEKQGSIRARIGYGFDRGLIYATGGLAIGDIEYTATDFSGTNTDGETDIGYTLGAGIDYAVTDALFLRGEYRFTDYGSETISTAANDYEFDTEMHTIQAGIGYKF